MASPLADNWPAGRWFLDCVDITSETHDVKSFHFRVLPRGDGPAPLCLHRPGQFVTLRLRHGDALVLRSYTISSPPSRPFLMSLTIKRDPNGLVSRFMHDRLMVGDRLPVNGPGGNFDLQSVEPRARILMLTGGSGITPAMSMLRYIHDMRQSRHDVTFFHSARTPDDIIFRAETALIAESGNTAVRYICERDAEPGMFQGFLSREILEQEVPDIHERTVLTCGPAPYMDAVRTFLAEVGFDMSHCHEESFGNPSERENPDGATPETLAPDAVGDVLTARTAADATADTTTEDAGKIVFSLSGRTADYKSGETILAIATREGIAVPTNCQMGLCGTCKAKASGGAVRMDDTEGLEPGEAEEGFVLTCCGRPSGLVIVEL